MNTKVCTKCGEEKPTTEEHFCRISHSGNLRGECKECTSSRDRRAYLRRKYGLTPEDFQDLLESQGGCCAACGRSDPVGDHWHTDHDHDTGEVRGILCANCNRALGLLGDSPAAIREVLSYLTSPPAQEAQCE